MNFILHQDFIRVQGHRIFPSGFQTFFFFALKAEIGNSSPPHGFLNCTILLLIHYTFLIAHFSGSIRLNELVWTGVKPNKHIVCGRKIGVHLQLSHSWWQGCCSLWLCRLGFCALNISWDRKVNKSTPVSNGYNSHFAARDSEGESFYLSVTLKKSHLSTCHWEGESFGCLWLYKGVI